MEKGSAFLSKVVVKSTLSYNAVLVFHLHSKEFGLVYQKFEEFLESGFVPDIKSLTVVVQALFMLNKIKKVDEILDLYTNGDYKIDSMFIQIVVTGYIRAKFVEKANYFYGYFIQQGFEPSEKLYASLICNYCHVGDLGTASYLYQAFLDLNYKPTHSLHMAFIKGYCVRRDYESAMSVFNSMENLNLVPDTYTFNSAIKLFIKAGKRGQALNLLEQMSRQCVEKNHITSCLMIHFHSRFGTEQELLQACKDHHLGGHKMDEYCLLRLVEFYSRNGNFTRALEYANRIAHLETVERPSYAHNVILNLLRRDTLNPQSIIDYMNSLLVTDIPDCKTLGIYIKALSESGRYELMESVIENEVIRRVKPDISLIGIIIDSYLRADNKKRCLDWYKYLQKNGMTPSPFIRRTMSFVEKMDMFQSRSKSMYHLFTSLTSHLRYGKNIAAKVRRMGKIRSYQKALVNETNEAKKKRLQSLIKRLNFRDVELANRRFRRRMVMKGKNPQATLRKNEVTAHAIARKLPVIIDSFKEYHVPFSAKTAIPADSKLLKVV